ncbi:MAG: F0F1 ATP synthase subunit delta, partial [Oceanospirillaceae bacterium]|nr:F0F1 ATP synthase subunit delta [Oceanospirillaceae bacterium]
MAESITVARPYTKAAFETALAQGDLGSWSE